MGRPDVAVLVVEDDPETRALSGAVLAGRGYHCELAGDAASARKLLLEGKFELALCDVHLPDESGLQLARHIGAEHGDTAVLIVSAEDDPEVAAGALEFGAYGYVIKPFRPQQLAIAVAAAMRRRDEELAARRQREALTLEASALRNSVAEFERATRSADEEDQSAAAHLARAISARSHETGDHLERVGRASSALARRVGLPAERCALIEKASRLHDIGKVAVSDRVLLKPGPLSAEERAEVERHAEVGHYVLAGSDNELLRLAADIALTHHERFDGNGYPEGRAGEDIPLEGRIVAIADVFDALTSDRAYRPALSHQEAIELMCSERGRQFDPDLLDAFIASLDRPQRPKAGVDLARS